MAGLSYRQEVEECVAFLRTRLEPLPEIVIQLGTGLGDLAERLEGAVSLPYSELPHFPLSTVPSHQGNLVCGRLGRHQVAVLQGRFHYYEGYSTREVTFPIRVLSLLGATTAIITNASGGLRSEHAPGEIMVIDDHLNLLPENPLRGANVEAWGERFPDLSTPYDPVLREQLLAVAKTRGITGLCSGTYACIPGPSLETPAETRYLKIIGADAVGMSSVPEVIVAIHAGMRVLGLSVVANVNDPDNFQPILLEEIVQAAQAAGPRLQELIAHLLEEF
ncbi:purine-nucleoside phosphorylase [Desulfogranum mediterraneum]|uniref:purine-nucleoside phosphorylase n=1 Tax=Desulfogranum mediterraneum TaxID=160661 RepID=UPI0004086480|nr:purine-nucleoside phosphorylase [Desulfogranum mediterraneum]